MKRFLFPVLLFCLVSGVLAQEKSYVMLSNIPYYSKSVNQVDSYVKEQCVLDLYYPKNEKAFATIVWFHGGSLTEGDKEIPEALKNKGFCIVSVNCEGY